MPDIIKRIKFKKFGVEIEMTGLTRAKAAEAVAKFFHTTADHPGGCYDKYTVTDPQGRKCTLICTYEGIQQLVRELRSAGGVCNSSTGINIHIDAAPYNARVI